MRRIALITGGNKGIGKEIARKLGNPSNNILAIIGCRSSELGTAAAEELRAEGCNVIFKQLDICDTSNIKAVCDNISEEHGYLDILVNNAGIAFKGSDPTPFQKQASPTVNVNFFGSLNVIKSFLPLLRKSNSPRIVNVASLAGHLKILPTKERKAMFTSSELKVEDVESLMREFVSDVESGIHQSKGWPSSNYGMSKLGLIALTNVLAREEPQIMVNSCCPGYCSTDMSSNRGGKTAEDGARTPAMLALMKEHVSGKYFSGEKEEAW
eukprot:CAMPEP_0119037932 /NCGR_PEP_ID=MMETSP1177-20130426/6497_1 /TAXON_ID=2985 /ORGANISM="Ochromonas sp, Strain CCMP1899" /LENGTH=267 /DNA_ID=CAMNT_0006999765 /DNA_START=147 /DNA_END=950 /DNA_ORIENTATION=-